MVDEDQRRGAARTSPRRVRCLKTLADALAAIGAELPLRLPAGCELRVVTAAQGALLDFMAENPYCTIERVEVVAGEPQLVCKRIAETVVQKFRMPSPERPGQLLDPQDSAG